MTLGLTTLLFFGLLVLFLALGVPLVFSFGAVSIVFITWHMGVDALYMIAATAYNQWTSAILIAIPLFVLMANLLQRSGIAEDLFQMMYVWFGRIRGGLAMGTVAICAIFGAMSGISAVGTVTMGMIALPSMLKRGYSKEIAVGCISAGGTLGILIPPSVLMIVYAYLTGASVGKMFAAGLIPGVLLTVFFVAYIGIRCIINPQLGPAVPADEDSSFAAKIKSLLSVIAPVFLIMLVLGLMYLGVCTAMEASAIGAMGALIVLIINKRFSWKVLHESLTGTCRMSAMIMWIFLGAVSFSHIYSAMGAADMVASFFTALEVNRWVMMVAMQLTLIVLGCFMDPGGIIVICIPVFMPIIAQLGFDPIWFGIMFVINMELGYITPPFGFNLFYMKAMATPHGINMQQIYRSVIPFVLLVVLLLALCMIFPDIILWLPSQLKF
ncbi:MAG: TRAP dicarboxylate transporter subunit DctM [Desulfatitalea sp. BRH_c12]|nr:MAG: TRAP dicarboxylate transporter subunit DctM [Desulfatitalea sp. BRH_c12]